MNRSGHWTTEERLTIARVRVSRCARAALRSKLLETTVWVLCGKTRRRIDAYSIIGHIYSERFVRGMHATPTINKPNSTPHKKLICSVYGVPTTFVTSVEDTMGMPRVRWLAQTCCWGRVIEHRNSSYKNPKSGPTPNSFQCVLAGTDPILLNCGSTAVGHDLWLPRATRSSEDWRPCKRAQQ